MIKGVSTIRAKEGLVGVVKKFNFMQWFEAKQKFNKLRTVPTIVTARGLVLSPVSLGGSSYFLWKRCVVFQQMKNNFSLPCQFFENRRSMRVLLFLRMIDLTEHFIVKQKSILKHQKLLLQDVTLRAWVLKNPLIGKDQ